MGTLVPTLSRPTAILWLLSHRWESNPPRRAEPLQRISRNQAFFPSSNAFLFSSKNFAGTIASRDFCQASSGRSK